MIPLVAAGQPAETEFAGHGNFCRLVYVSLTIKYELSPHRNLKAASAKCEGVRSPTEISDQVFAKDERCESTARTAQPPRPPHRTRGAARPPRRSRCPMPARPATAARPRRPSGSAAWTH